MNIVQFLVFNVFVNKFLFIELKLINLLVILMLENYVRFLSINKTVMEIVFCKLK